MVAWSVTAQALPVADKSSAVPESFGGMPRGSSQISGAVDRIRSYRRNSGGFRRAPEIRMDSSDRLIRGSY